MCALAGADECAEHQGSPKDDQRDHGDEGEAEHLPVVALEPVAEDPVEEEHARHGEQCEADEDHAPQLRALHEVPRCPVTSARERGGPDQHIAAEPEGVGDVVGDSTGEGGDVVEIVGGEDHRRGGGHHRHRGRSLLGREPQRGEQADQQEITRRVGEGDERRRRPAGLDCRLDHEWPEQEAGAEADDRDVDQVDEPLTPRPVRHRDRDQADHERRITREVRDVRAGWIGHDACRVDRVPGEIAAGPAGHAQRDPAPRSPEARRSPAREQDDDRRGDGYDHVHRRPRERSVDEPARNHHGDEGAQKERPDVCWCDSPRVPHTTGNRLRSGEIERSAASASSRRASRTRPAPGDTRPRRRRGRAVSWSG